MFERVGKLLTGSRRGWLLVLFLAGPFSALLLFFGCKFSSLRHLEELYLQTERTSHAALEQRARKERFLARYAESDPYFLSQHIEPIEFLSLKKEAVRKKIEHPACPNRARLKRELAQYEQMQNRMIFLEEGFKTSKRGMKESDEKLRNPVKLELRDLELVLCSIEGTPIGTFVPSPHAPQMIIKDFSLIRKEDDFYEMDLSLLKREFPRD